MPDWLTHTLVGWITGKTIKQDIALIVIGSLIPDLVKISLLFSWLGINENQFLQPIHTPIGTLVLAGIISLSFKDIKKAFLPLTIGVTTHFVLDFFLVHAGGGMKLLFPFSWSEWQYYLIRSDNYWITNIAIIAAALIFAVYWNYDQKRRLSINIK